MSQANNFHEFKVIVDNIAYLANEEQKTAKVINCKEEDIPDTLIIPRSIKIASASDEYIITSISK